MENKIETLKKIAAKKEEKIVKSLSTLESLIATLKKEVQSVSHPELTPRTDDRFRVDVQADALYTLSDGQFTREFIDIGSQARDLETLLETLRYLEKE